MQIGPATSIRAHASDKASFVMTVRDGQDEKLQATKVADSSDSCANVD